jgi:hypothetical protein
MKAAVMVLGVLGFQFVVSIFMGKVIRAGRRPSKAEARDITSGSLAEACPADEDQYEPRGASTALTVRARM